MPYHLSPEKERYTQKVTMTVDEEAVEETQPFREPSGNFRDILSRWKAHDNESDLTLNPNSIASHASRKKKDTSQHKKNHPLSPSNGTTSGTGASSSLPSKSSAHGSRRHLIREQSSDDLDDPYATALFHDDDDEDDNSFSTSTPPPPFSSPSPAAPPLRKNVTAMIEKFNQTVKKEKEPIPAMPTTLLKRSKTVGDAPVGGTATVESRYNPTSTTSTTTTTNVAITATPSSGAKKNWSKLKVAGVAAKASVRLRNRLTKRDRLPKNIYQKPLFSSEDFQPPVFQHTTDERTLIRQALKKNFVFADLKETELSPLIQAFEKCTYVANEKIIRQGSQGDYFYIIYDGKVNFDVNGTTVGRARKGNSFGELALLYTCPRAATVTADRDCVLFRVDQNSFRHILRNQTKQSEQAKIDLLRGVDFFSELATSDIEKLSHVMTPLIFSPDKVLCQKGEMGDKFYVLQEGSVLITDISVGSTRYEDQTLGPGQYWGERSLVTGEPRAANVIAKSYGVAFTIDREMFQKTFGHLSSMVSRSQDGRRLAGVKLIYNANLTPAQITALAQAMTDVTFRAGKTVFQKGDLASPALYFVRSGSVNVEKRGNVTEISSGGYFGEEVMQFAVKQYMPSVPSPITATCTAKTVLAELKLSKCRNIFDVQLLAGRSSEAFSLGEVDDSDNGDDQEDIVVERLKTMRSTRQQSLKPKVRPKVKLNDLEKIKLLGAGTFGQVWLVSDKSKSDKTKSVFALKVQVGGALCVCW
jgi:CRP-like cAMP-binding protein